MSSHQEPHALEISVEIRSAQTTSPPSASFRRFSSLSRELRDEIWRQALPPPRRILRRSSEKKIHYIGGKENRLYPPHCPPHVLETISVDRRHGRFISSILRACFESRLVVLKHYSGELPDVCKGPMRLSVEEMKISGLHLAGRFIFLYEGGLWYFTEGGIVYWSGICGILQRKSDTDYKFATARQINKITVRAVLQHVKG